MLLGLLGASAVIILTMRYRSSGWTTAHLRNDIVAIVLLAAFARVLLKVLAL